MSLETALNDTTPFEATANWLRDFESVAKSRDARAARGLFLDEGHWRDLSAITWHIETTNGGHDIAALLDQTITSVMRCCFVSRRKRLLPTLLAKAAIWLGLSH